MNFKEGAAVKKLELGGGKTFNGNVAEHFKKAKPFEFLPAKAN
jgi:hypothetical protein